MKKLDIFPIKRDKTLPYQKAFESGEFVVQKPVFLVVVSNILELGPDILTNLELERAMNPDLVEAMPFNAYIAVATSTVRRRINEMYEAGLTDSSQRDNVLHICLAGMMVDLMNGASHPVNGADMIEMETVAGLMDMISQEAASSVTFLHEAIEALRKADEYVEGISDTVMKLVVSVDKNSTEAIVVAGRQVDATIRAYVSISELSDPDRFFGYSI